MVRLTRSPSGARPASRQVIGTGQEQALLAAPDGHSGGPKGSEAGRRTVCTNTPARRFLYTRFAALRRGEKAGKWREKLEKRAVAARAHYLVLAYGMG